MSGFYADVRARLDLSELDKLNKIKDKTINVKINADTAALNDIATILKGIQTKTITIKSNTSGVDGAGKSIDGLTTKLRQAQAESNKLSQVQAKLSQAKSNFSSLDKAAYGNASGYKTMESNIAQAEAAMNRYNAMVQSGTATQAELNVQLSQVGSYAQKATTQYNSMTTAISRLEAETASNKVMAWLANNSKVNKDPALAQSIRSIGDAMKGVSDRGQLASLNKELQNYISLAQSKGLTGQSWFAGFKKSFGAIAQFTGIYALLRTGIMRGAREIIQAVKDVDSAMIELRKVSDASSNELANYFDVAAESAKKYGATISDVINSTADFSRLGYSLKDASKLSEVATLYKNVGDGIDIDTASSSIVSTMKAFNIEAENSISIVDKFNEVGNNFAISSGGIGDALSRSASSLAVAGNTLDEAIALITAGKQYCLKNMETYFHRTHLIARVA